MLFLKNPINYSRQNINKNDIKKVKNVLESDFLTQGPKVEELKMKLINFVKVGIRLRVIVQQVDFTLLVWLWV